MADDLPPGAVVLSALDEWIQAPDSGRFPLGPLVSHINGVGKHFLAPELLTALDRARRAWAGHHSGDDFLADFLDVVLDKYDDRYDYPSYTALPLLACAPGRTMDGQRIHRDRTVALLMADVVRFETDAQNGRGREPSGMRPGPSAADKRRRLATRVMAPPAYRLLDAAGRHELPRDAGTVADPDRLAEAVHALATPEATQALTAAMLPVYTLHDEHLFLRTLQAFEATFWAMAGMLEEAVGVLRREHPGDAATLIGGVAELLAESLPLFSLLATMQPEAFQTFREFTDGASAIQSEGYKTFESLCSTPGLDRLNAPAFLSVPAVREQVLEGRPTAEGTWEDVISTGWLDQAGAEAVREAARRLERTHQRWKQTHYRLAVRMLGTRTGTGSTEGVPYLESVLRNRLFRTLNEPASAVV